MGHKQRGLALVMGLLLLMLITILAVTGARLSRSNLAVTGNMQLQDEMVASANSVIQEAISTVRVFQNPDAILLDPCGEQQNTRCVDIDADGADDITVQLNPAPSCVVVRTIPNRDLNLADPDDLGCALGIPQSLGVQGSTTGNSLCADSIWEVSALATDVNMGAQARVTEGVSIRVSVDDVDSSCP